MTDDSERKWNELFHAKADQLSKAAKAALSRNDFDPNRPLTDAARFYDGSKDGIVDPEARVCANLAPEGACRTCVGLRIELEQTRYREEALYGMLPPLEPGKSRSLGGATVVRNKTMYLPNGVVVDLNTGLRVKS